MVIKIEELKIFTCDICKEVKARKEFYSSCFHCGKGICNKCFNKLKEVNKK